MAQPLVFVRLGQRNVNQKPGETLLSINLLFQRNPFAFSKLELFPTFFDIDSIVALAVPRFVYNFQDVCWILVGSPGFIFQSKV